MRCIQCVAYGLCCAFLSILAGCDRQNNDSTGTIHPVRAMQVSSAEYQPDIEVTGEIKAKIQTELSFKVGGKVTERRVNIGTLVKAGDILARLDNTEQRADMKNAQATLKSAQATFQRKTLTYQRYKTLLSARVIAEADYDQTFTDMITAQNSVASAQADLATAMDNLSNTMLKADADGVITALNIEIGQVVSATQSVLTLAHDGVRDAVFNVFEAYFINGEPLKMVSIHPIDESGYQTMGVIREISPIIDSATGTIRVKVSLPKETPWPLGTPITGKFHQYARNGIALPWTSMDSNYGDPAVWVINTSNHEVSMRKVTVAQYRSEDFIVTKGLQPNEWVVVDGGRFLREGQTVSWDEN
ncbi:Multidrug resistance protein MdtE precursor [Dickeya solani]|uniref:Component of multidrug efflux system (RND family) n=2 Tax=Dickeya solani TaxID=1089444 RepID=A0AAV3KBF2_9GAMM|nr:efflux transporter periplasmic adaptor subunit [Dickeya solani D s0432-1]AUH12238.1 efflux transporter periplasmic adaptor subunit [Dickeya solani]AYQ46844.1 Multidrug resistance protein MdtE precursor [Dickeya solani]AYQ51016.1 Multidrug resistance protein MdtE precursor [Dickeya solani]ERO57826.1 Putative component of multidrug efflux system (RND family) [Dickeya solani D s0432-1]